MIHSLTVKRVQGKEILPYIEDLAALRIHIFKEYPYLYDGDKTYESEYLKTYIACPASVMVLVFDKDKIVGASTAIPLEFEMSEFKQPFIEAGMEIKDIFYLGESLLRPQYRGQKIYRHFFNEREAAAREYGCSSTAFCAIKRNEQDPRKPKHYKPLDEVWKHFGYTPYSNLCAYLAWKEIGDLEATLKPLTFWIKKL